MTSSRVSTPMRASAATRRVSAVSGIRSSSASASALSSSAPRRTSSSASATHRPLVAGLELEHLPQRRLVARREERGHGVLLLGGQQAGDELAHVGLGLGADEAVDHLAVLQGVHGRDALHLERRGRLRVRVDVDLGQHDLAAGLVDHLLEDRAERLARAAPLRPQVDHDGHLLGALDHLGGEGGIGDVDRMGGNVPAAVPSPTWGDGPRERMSVMAEDQGRRRPPGHRRGSRRTSPARRARSPSTSSPAATPTSPTGSPTPTAPTSCCAARRSATCSPPPTTWAASTRSSPPSAPPTCRSRRPSASAPTTTVNGAPFYVMDFVDGLVLRDAAAATSITRRRPPQRQRLDRRHAGQDPRRRPRRRRPRRPRQEGGLHRAPAQALVRPVGEVQDPRAAARRRDPRRAARQGPRAGRRPRSSTATTGSTTA